METNNNLQVLHVGPNYMIDQYHSLLHFKGLMYAVLWYFVLELRLREEISLLTTNTHCREQRQSTPQ